MIEAIALHNNNNKSYTSNVFPEDHVLLADMAMHVTNICTAAQSTLTISSMNNLIVYKHICQHKKLFKSKNLIFFNTQFLYYRPCA